MPVFTGIVVRVRLSAALQLLLNPLSVAAMPLPTVFEAIKDIVSRRTERITVFEMQKQWRNPNDVLSVIMLIGGDIVQTALAQLSGTLPLVPVCFSFGWITMAFTNIVALAGDGRLMPRPDYDCKVVNVDTGYVRANRSWMLGRILRDSEGSLQNESLCVTIWEAVGGEGNHPVAGQPVICKLWIWSLCIIISQIVLAAIPLILDDDWGVLLITSAGSLLALLTGSLPQWRAEKYACRTSKSKKRIILTGGNGTRHAMFINGNGKCLDLEDLAGGEGPRVRRSWNKYGYFRRNAQPQTYAPKPSVTSQSNDIVPHVSPQEPEKEAIVLGWLPGSLPADFWFTRFICLLFAIFWILLLISVTGLKRNAWFILLVGAIGMLQNAFVASVPRKPETRGVHLEEKEPIKQGKVMDVLMDLEYDHPQAGRCLLEEYFPGELRPEEEAWWDAAQMRRRTIEYKKRTSEGKPAIPPDWKALQGKYGGEKAWLEIATKYDAERREEKWRGEPRGLPVTEEDAFSSDSG